jgi:hypothetical protein
MTEVSRRDLLTGAVAAGAAAAAAVGGVWDAPAYAQYVWAKSDWQAAEFEKLTHVQRRIKQVVHAFDINDGRFLRNTKNSLNGLHFGIGVPEDQIQLACALNGPANMLCYSDYVWEKPHYSSDDPSNEHSMYQDTSVQALQSRGVRFISCHTATEEQARGVIKRYSLAAEPEEVTKDMVAHALPGVLLVPALAAALAYLQCEGHYSYMAA